MRRRIFIQAIEEYRKQIVKKLCDKYEHEDVRDAFQDMTARFLESKIYLQCNHESLDHRMKGYIMQATSWELQQLLRKKTSQGNQVMHIVENEDGSEFFTGLKEELSARDILECPFCHTGVLNQYRACADCHTILGSERGPTKVYTLENMVESECPDLGMFADVNLALDALDDIEKKVVHHIVQGNESLEDLVELMRIPRTALWRIWTGAKAKLQQALFEYSHVNQ